MGIRLSKDSDSRISLVKASGTDEYRGNLDSLLPKHAGHVDIFHGDLVHLHWAAQQASKRGVFSRRRPSINYVKAA